MAEHFFIPSAGERYRPLLDARRTRAAQELIEDTFTRELKRELNLSWVPGPLIVPADSGINDDLTGVEQKVSFTPLVERERVAPQQLEVIQSLAKWKRRVLSDKRQYDMGEGILAHTTALRRDDDIDNLHSLTVQQWDFEFIISEEQRNVQFLKERVRAIWAVVKRTERAVRERFGDIGFPILPDEIEFVHSEHLFHMLPDHTPEEREFHVTRKYGAVFIIGIGGTLLDSESKHSSRAPDYDDWTSVTGKYGRRFQTKGLNGDIFVWSQVLERAVELSSLGIRVDKGALQVQCQMLECTERLELPFHRSLLEGELPQTLGGGIGKARLMMLLLGNAHVGECHVSYWPKGHRNKCKQYNIPLLE